MKKLFVILCLISFISCGGGNSSKDSVKVKRTIHGKAAIGAFIDEGAKVQVRPAPVGGVPCDIIESTVADGQGTISADVSSPTQLSGKTNIDAVEPTGYIIRVYSSTNGSWIYSYADNTDVDIVSNSNPYTDKMIRQFYFADSNNVGIDSLFSTGFLQDGVTPINVPDGNNVVAVMDVMSRMLKDTYNLSNIQNALIDTWQVDAGLDWLLNQVGGHLAMWLQNEFQYLFMYPDALISSNVYEDDYSPTVNTIHVDIWTAYGNTGNVTLSGITGYWSDTLLVKQPDSVTGNNHYKATIVFNTSGGYLGNNVSIVIDDYQSGASVPVALKRY